MTSFRSMHIGLFIWFCMFSCSKYTNPGFLWFSLTILDLCVVRVLTNVCVFDFSCMCCRMWNKIIWSTKLMSPRRETRALSILSIVLVLLLFSSYFRLWRDPVEMLTLPQHCYGLTNHKLVDSIPPTYLLLCW